MAGNLINLDKSTIFVKRDQIQMFFFIATLALITLKFCKIKKKQQI